MAYSTISFERQAARAAKHGLELVKAKPKGRIIARYKGEFVYDGYDPVDVVDMAINLAEYRYKAKEVDTPRPTVVKKVFTPDNRLKVALKGCDSIEVVAKVNGVWKDSYAKLGPGQLRMTVGNHLRRKMAAGLPVVIGNVKL